MKKLLFSLAFLLLVVPSASFAGEQYGVYVAPKLMLGITNGDVNTYATTPIVADIAIKSGESFNKAIFGGALALGYNFNTKFSFPVRVELEYALFGNASKSYSYAYPANQSIFMADTREHYKGTLSIQSLMLNTYFDIHNSTKFTPYVTAGLGLGFVGLKVNSALEFNTPGVAVGTEYINLGSKRKTNFAWTIGLGCAYDINDNISIDAGYRYGQFGKAQSQSVVASDGLGNSVSVNAKTSTIGMHQFMVGVRFTF